MKVYVVTAIRNWEGRRDVIAVYSDLETAISYCEEYNPDTEPQIEEFPLGEFDPDKTRTWYVTGGVWHE